MTGEKDWWRKKLDEKNSDQYAMKNDKNFGEKFFKFEMKNYNET